MAPSGQNTAAVAAAAQGVSAAPALHLSWRQQPPLVLFSSHRHDHGAAVFTPVHPVTRSHQPSRALRPAHSAKCGCRTRSGRAAIGWSVPNAQDRGKLTYGILFKITLSPYGRFQSEESSAQEITLPAPIGTIRYRGSPAGTSFTDASTVLFSGAGYQTRVEAETAARALKNVVLLASIDAGIAIDAGQDEVLGGPGQLVVDAAAEQGVLLLPDVHGLQVFEESGRPASISIIGHGIVTAPLRSFASALLIRSHRTTELDAKRSLASQLHGLSRLGAALLR